MTPDPLDPRSYGTRAGEASPDGTLPEGRPPARRAAAPPPTDPYAADPYDPEIAGDGQALDDEDRELLVALAAMQLRYGEAAEAVAYLMAARRIFPGDADVLRLLADALLKLGRVDEADEVLSELDRLPARRRPTVALLTRALVRLAQGRGGEARRLFSQYRDARDHNRDAA